jgi:ubiquinone/menaquinone biosynthesis C-methylase UbiE
MVFGEEYARAYDLLYQDKDYEKECDFIEETFRKYDYKPESILDLGCGTGNHAIILAKRGYKITGVDRAASMLEIAKRKAQDADLNIKFVEGDITKIAFERKFDAVISMFAVMSYQVTNVAVAAVCKMAKEALVPGGMFIFDCWHGSAVIADKPTNKIKEVDAGNGEKVIRFTEPEMDFIHNLVNVRFRLQQDNGGEVRETLETHSMRFFFPQDIKQYMETAGFGKIELYPFLDLHRPLSDGDWNMTVVGCSI